MVLILFLFNFPTRHQLVEAHYIKKHTPSVLNHTEDYEKEDFRTPMKNTLHDFSGGSLCNSLEY